MTKMAMFYVVTYFGFLAGGLFHPIWPLVSYLTFYYLPPHLNWWGDAIPDLRFSLTASMVLFASVVLLRSGLEYQKRERNISQVFLVLFGLNAIFVTFVFAVNSARSWVYAVLVLKLIFLYLLMPAAIRTPAQFDVFGAAHVAGASYWGYKAWDNPHREAGRLEDVGGPDTQNDNQAAGHLLTVLPFAALYALTATRKWRKVLALTAAAFLVNVFVLCNSRGATLGLLTAGATAVLLAGKGRRSRLIGVGLAGLVGLLMLADTQFIERQQTTANATDNSALSRLVMWRAGIELVKDHPFGAGGRAFHELSFRYIPGILAQDKVEERSPHNTYIQMATDWGIQGTIFFFGYLVTTSIMLYRVRKRMPHNPWYFYRSLTVQVALVGTMTAAFFSSRLYGESIYWMGAVAFALHRIQSTELERTPSESTNQAEPAAPLRAAS